MPRELQLSTSASVPHTLTRITASCVDGPRHHCHVEQTNLSHSRLRRVRHHPLPTRGHARPCVPEAINLKRRLTLLVSHPSTHTHTHIHI
jgi:hypothetical protein